MANTLWRLDFCGGVAMPTANIKYFSSTQHRQLQAEGGMTIGSALDAAWGRLSDFTGWPGWVPGVEQAGLTSRLPPGRGAKIRVQFEKETCDFTIAHWEPSRRLALVRETPALRVACVFDLHGEDDRLRLTATVELQCFGLGRLIGFLYTSKYRRRCLALLNAWGL